MSIEILKADYRNPYHAREIVRMLNAYAADLSGGASKLCAATLANLPAELAKLPHAFSLLAYKGGTAVGLANCFEGFSTFACRPLVNVHDMAVLPEFRGRGISQLLLQKIEQLAREKNCCKITLEVLEGNDAAKAAYLKFGFEAYQLAPAMGQALFWQKKLDASP